MFLCKDFNFKELLELFDILDTKQDGILDQYEFEQLFQITEPDYSSNLLQSRN